MTLSGGCCEDAALSCGCQAGVAGGSSSDAVCSPGPAAAVVTAHLAELDPTEMKHVTCSHVLSDRLAYAAVTNIPSALNTTAYSSLVSAAGTGDRVSLTWHLPAAAAPGAPLAAGEGGLGESSKVLGNDSPRVCSCSRVRPRGCPPLEGSRRRSPPVPDVTVLLSHQVLRRADGVTEQSFF